MKIIEFPAEPLMEIPYLNAGRGPGQFYEDRLLVHVARAAGLPDGVAAVIATADLQGRERFEDSPGEWIRLLGEALPERLRREVLPRVSIRESDRVGVLLAGDFYTVPALDQRGGTGDVTGVWQAFADCFTWVAGVPGNHDTFGDPSHGRPRFPARLQYLDGDVTEIDGLRIAGLGGIIGKASRHNRREAPDYLNALCRLLDRRPDILLLHEGPDGALPGQPGMADIREVLQRPEAGLVIRGHKHWSQPFAEFPGGLQVLNVDARVVILVR